MSYADASGEAWHGVRGWQELARQRARPLATAISASIAAHLAVRDGDIRQALAFGEQALATADSWVAILATAFLVPALIDAGETGRALALLAEHGLSEGDLLPVFPFNVAQYARGCLRAAAGDHEAAVTDLVGVGAVATRWGIVNPAAIPWRSAAALSHSALGASAAARRLAVRRSPPALGPPGDRVACAPRAGRAGARHRLLPGGDVLRARRRLELARALLDSAPPTAGGCQGHRTRPAAREPGSGPRARRARASRPGQGRAGGRGRQAPQGRHPRPRLAHPQRAACRRARRRGPHQPADRTGALRHPAHRGEPPDEHLRQARHQRQA